MSFSLLNNTAQGAIQRLVPAVRALADGEVLWRSSVRAILDGTNISDNMIRYRMERASEIVHKETGALFVFIRGGLQRQVPQTDALPRMNLFARKSARAAGRGIKVARRHRHQVVGEAGRMMGEKANMLGAVRAVLRAPRKAAAQPAPPPTLPTLPK